MYVGGFFACIDRDIFALLADGTYPSFNLVSDKEFTKIYVSKCLASKTKLLVHAIVLPMLLSI